ncbi:MAG: glycosyltransferase family 2 protein [Bacteroidota bacterium]
MSKCILSICIATYNRARFISETLESVLPQLTGEVEVVVVDGASTDATEAIMNEFVKRSNRIRYFRLPQKGGVDQDYNKSVELAQGEMCWLFTDDDILKPGAIAAVMNAISQNHSLIVVNAEIRNTDLSKTLQSHRMQILEDTIYAEKDSEKLFIDMADYLTFIGAVIIRKSVWMSRERQRYYGTEFIHIGVLFQEVIPGTSKVIAEPYIVIRYGNAQWESRRFNIWMFKWPKLIWSFKNISDTAKMQVVSPEPWRSIRSLIVKRSDGEYNLQMYRNYLAGQIAGTIWKACAIIISLFPRWIIMSVRIVYACSKKL